MEKKLDLRVQKTYRNLFTALQELLCEKGLNDITVTELCERAQTRKATFYKHFGDKTELFSFMIQEIQREYQSSIYEAAKQKKESPDGDSYYTSIFLYYLNFLETHETMVFHMMQDDSRTVTFDLLSRHIQDDLTRHLLKDQKAGILLSAPAELVAAMYTGVITQSSRWWLRQKTRMPKEELARQFDTLVRCFQSGQP